MKFGFFLEIRSDRKMFRLKSALDLTMTDRLKSVRVLDLPYRKNYLGTNVFIFGRFFFFLVRDFSEVSESIGIDSGMFSELQGIDFYCRELVGLTFDGNLFSDKHFKFTLNLL